MMDMVERLGEDMPLSVFRRNLSSFFDRHAPEEAMEQWRAAGVVERSLWLEAGTAGLLAPSIPAAYGGRGLDFRYELAVFEEVASRGLEGFGISVHSRMAAPYILHLATSEQKALWLPGIVSGEIVLALAATEPAAGSDLKGIQCRAVRHADHYLINGQKTYISNGQTSDLIVLACKTEGDSFSLFVVEAGSTPGFARGRNLRKMGREAQDTSELFFADARIPAANLLGGVEGQGFRHMAKFFVQERLVIAVMAQAVMERAVRLTIDYARTRQAFGAALIQFQNTKFKLAECSAQVAAGRAFVDRAIDRHLAGTLDAVEAAKLKLWITEAQCRIVDECLQIFGGYGYMDECPISRMFRDARIDRINGGSSEMMKTIIARSF